MNTHKKVTWTVVMSLCLVVFLAGGSRKSHAEEASGREDTSSADGTGVAENDLARARSLFVEGVEFSDRGEFAQAAERFENALTLHDAPTIRYNLAATYVELNRAADAANQLEQILQAEDAPEELKERARVLLQEVTRTLGRVLLTQGEISSSAVVTLDGQVLEDEQIDVPLHVTAGEHVVVATVNGVEVLRHEVEVTVGTMVEIQLEAHQDAVPLDAMTTGDGDGEEEDRPLLRDWRLWTGVGAGVVVIVTAIVLGVTLGGNNDEVEDPIEGNMTPGVLTWP